MDNNKALVIEGVSEWQIGYFVATFDSKFKNVKYDIIDIDESNTKIAMKFKNLSTWKEFRLIRLLQKNNMSFYLGTLKA